MDALSRRCKVGTCNQELQTALSTFAVLSAGGQLPRGRSRSGTRLLGPGTRKTRAPPALGRCAGGGHAARCSEVAWRIPRREGPGGSQRRTRLSHLRPRKSARGPPGRTRGDVSTLTGAPDARRGPARLARLCWVRSACFTLRAVVSTILKIAIRGTAWKIHSPSAAGVLLSFDHTMEPSLHFSSY